LAKVKRAHRRIRHLQPQYRGGGQAFGAPTRFSTGRDVDCLSPQSQQRRCLWGAIADRFAACKLVLHPQKTKIVLYEETSVKRYFIAKPPFSFLAASVKTSISVHSAVAKRSSASPCIR
jgi:hypothetical protein